MEKEEGRNRKEGEKNFDACVSQERIRVLLLTNGGVFPTGTEEDEMSDIS